MTSTISWFSVTASPPCTSQVTISPFGHALADVGQLEFELGHTWKAF
jgi:hypothetical protein